MERLSMNGMMYKIYKEVGIRPSTLVLVNFNCAGCYGHTYF